MKSWLVVPAACAAVLMLGGCGSNNDNATPGAEGTVVGQATGGDDNGSGPDSPVDADNQGAADLPSLPIGGDAAFDSADSPICATVAFNWNGGDLPAGVAVRISQFSYPDGIGPVDGGSCDGPPCLDADSFTADHQTCVVGLSWDGTAPTDLETFVISASGTLVCDSQDVCDQVKSEAESSGGAMSVEVPELTDSSSESSSP